MFSLGLGDFGSSMELGAIELLGVGAECKGFGFRWGFFVFLFGFFGRVI